MPTPRTRARAVSTCDILSLTLIIQYDWTDKQTDRQKIKTGSVLLPYYVP